MFTNDTIAAIATGNVISAIGIVRVSGKEACAAADKVFCAFSGVKMTAAADKKMYYGEIRDKHGDVIDLCLCMVSRGPKSYTGEDTVEFYCHGSPVVLFEVMQALFCFGVRQAEAGEFTKRAFLNGRMDLTQAEAVIDLIEAESAIGAKNAAGQLGGFLCEKLDNIYNRLVDIMAHFHAVIDYPDEDVDDFMIGSYLSVLGECGDELEALYNSHERGRVLHGGIPTAVIGRTNTGKSTLFNALLGRERAIVTDIAGTTRDTIEEKLRIGNILLRLTDTAGIRKTDDRVEKLGIERTRAAVDGAGLILAVFDGSQALSEEDDIVLEAVAAVQADVPVILVMNKADLPGGGGGCSGEAVEKLTKRTVPTVNISAKTGQGIDELCGVIRDLFPDYQSVPSGEIITSVRQAEAIGRAASGVRLAREALTDSVSPDAVLTDIEAALAAIGEVTGKTAKEDIISRIFERFCVGK